MYSVELCLDVGGCACTRSLLFLSVEVGFEVFLFEAVSVIDVSADFLSATVGVSDENDGRQLACPHEVFTGREVPQDDTPAQVFPVAAQGFLRIVAVAADSLRHLQVLFPSVKSFSR